MRSIPAPAVAPAEVIRLLAACLASERQHIDRLNGPLQLHAKRVTELQLPLWRKQIVEWLWEVSLLHDTCELPATSHSLHILVEWTVQAIFCIITEDSTLRIFTYVFISNNLCYCQ